MNDVPSPDMPVAAAGPGARLRAAREAAGLSLEEIALRLRLKTQLLRDLEEDRYDRLPATVWVRGYLQAYARQLNLPQDEILAAHTNMGLQETLWITPAEPQPTRPVRDNAPAADGAAMRWATIGGGVLLAVLLLIWWQGEVVRKSADLRTPPPGVQPPVAPAPDAPAAQGEAAPRAEGAPAAAAEAAPASQPLAATPAAPAAAPQPTAPAVAPAPATPPVPARPAASAPVQQPTGPVPTTAVPAIGGNDTLLVRVEDDSWVEVTDAAGNQLIYDILRAGSLRSLRGVAPFTVLLGNAAVVQLEFNGVNFPVPPREPGQVLRVRVGTR